MVFDLEWCNIYFLELVLTYFDASFLCSFFVIERAGTAHRHLFQVVKNKYYCF